MNGELPVRLFEILGLKVLGPLPPPPPPPLQELYTYILLL